ncbi:rod shape-determining protein MreD [Paenibacillus apis]|uniref:Rod shape-determining protein MreD n=1 Tax=Paenibacillus apis TaxID=1792174 RepID=A0A920CK77_9BACL|nr:rod shape-determining protein MreD [Paenibacillus apis]GIO43601.1 hypothetical protein J41TS4_33590 [Paenibacillus apis]
MIKRKYVLILLLFVLFIMEGTIVPWLVPSSWETRITPHFVYIAIIFFSVYENRHTGLVLGLVFGLLHDVVYYGSMIGAYSFAMGLSCYLLGLLSRSRQAPLPLLMIFVLLGSLLLETILYGNYKLFGLLHEPLSWAMLHHGIPNTLVQFVFALAIYVPLRKQLEIITKRRKPDEKS